MKHLKHLSRVPAVAAVPTTSLEIKLTGIIDVIDRLLLAQLQSPWKAAPTGGTTTGTTTDTTTGTNTGTTIPTL